jgi:hypothetical protein
MARMQRSLFAQLNALAEEISQNAEKVAAAKSAAPVPADPGGYQGASTHPSAHVDNDVQKATTGARAAEYEADLKKQQGPVGVDSTSELSQEGRQDDVQLNIGTNAAATGEDPSAEKDYKGTKDDPGTSHPAKANDGEKYSSVSFKEARDRAGALGNDAFGVVGRPFGDLLLPAHVRGRGFGDCHCHHRKPRLGHRAREHARHCKRSARPASIWSGDNASGWRAGFV